MFASVHGKVMKESPDKTERVPEAERGKDLGDKISSEPICMNFLKNNMVEFDKLNSSTSRFYILEFLQFVVV